MRKAIPDPAQFLQTDFLAEDLRARSVRSGAVTLVSKGIRFIVQMASAMMLGRLLTPHDFGLVAMVTGFFHARHCRRKRAAGGGRLLRGRSQRGVGAPRGWVV